MSGGPLGYRVRCKVWVESDEGSVLTPARVALMRQVLKYRSLAEAARALRIPYKKAHRLVASFDERLGGGVVERSAGGPSGGSTRLLDEGTRLLADYERLCNRVFDTLARATILGVPADVEVPGATREGCSPTALVPRQVDREADQDLYGRARIVSGHNCPGMVLGVRMAKSGMGELGLRPLENHPELKVTVETARCAADAIQAVSDTSLGRSSFRVDEFGKVAATFSVVGQEIGVRVLALESSRQAADALFPEVKGKKERQMRAYKVLPDDAILRKGRVRLLEPPARARRGSHRRAVCPRCSETFEPAYGAFDRGELLCRSCAGRSYFEPLPLPLAIP